MSLEELPPFQYRQPRMAYVEDVEKYVPGGYHPVDVGDVISAGDREYKVIHKLGHGGFSTVWLVQSCARSPSYFALKLLCAKASNKTDGELGILQHLRTVAGPGLGHPNVITLRDSFQVSGPNGEHDCLVFPILGPSLQKVVISAALSSTTRHQVCQQVASAMAFLHDQGVCHGDLTVSNIVFELPDMESSSPARISQLLGPIQAEKLRLSNGQRSPHAPKQVIQTPGLSGSIDYSLLTRIRIIDFGQAFFADRPPPSLGIPIDFFAPELCFGYLPSTKSDIWHLACVLYQTQTKTFLFPTGFRIFEILVGTIANYLGPIPLHWRGKFDFGQYGYYELGELKETTEPEWWFEDKHSDKTIDSRLAQEATHLSAHQQEEFARLLHEMVVYEPEKRLSAADVARRLGSTSFSDQDSSESV